MPPKASILLRGEDGQPVLNSVGRPIWMLEGRQCGTPPPVVTTHSAPDVVSEAPPVTEAPAITQEPPAAPDNAHHNRNPPYSDWYGPLILTAYDHQPQAVSNTMWRHAVADIGDVLFESAVQAIRDSGVVQRIPLAFDGTDHLTAICQNDIIDPLLLVALPFTAIPLVVETIRRAEIIQFNLGFPRRAREILGRRQSTPPPIPPPSSRPIPPPIQQLTSTTASRVVPPSIPSQTQVPPPVTVPTLHPVMEEMMQMIRDLQRNQQQSPPQANLPPPTPTVGEAAQRLDAAGIADAARGRRRERSERRARSSSRSSDSDASRHSRHRRRRSKASVTVGGMSAPANTVPDAAWMAPHIAILRGISVGTPITMIAAEWRTQAKDALLNLSHPLTPAGRQIFQAQIELFVAWMVALTAAPTTAQWEVARGILCQMATQIAIAVGGATLASELKSLLDDQVDKNKFFLASALRKLIASAPTSANSQTKKQTDASAKRKHY